MFLDQFNEDEEKKRKFKSQLIDRLTGPDTEHYTLSSDAKKHDEWATSKKQEKQLPAFNYDEYEKRKTPQSTNIPMPEKKDFWQGVRDKETEIGDKFKNSSLGKALDSAANSGVGKFISRVGDTGANMVTAGTAQLKPTDTGSKVGNFLADLVGGGSGMFLNAGGNASHQKVLSPIGNLAEKGTSKLTQNAPNVVKNLLPTMARGGVEQGIQEGINANLNGADTKETLETGLKGLGQGALFSGALKGANDYVLPTLKNNIVKTKTYEGSYTPKEPTNVTKETPDIITPTKKPPIVEPLNAKQEVAASNIETPTGERKFITNSVMNSKVVPDEIKKSLKDKPIEYAYIKHNNNDTLKNARDYVENNFNKAKSEINSKDALTSDMDTAVAIEVQRKLIQNGDFEGAREWSLKVAELGTKTGQAVQYFSVLKRFTPEWTLNYVQKTMDKTLTSTQREILKNTPKDQLEDVVKKFKIPYLTEDATKKIVEMSTAAQELTGRERAEAIAKLQEYVGQQIPQSVLSKINNVQTSFMLSSPKTAIRNIVSNLMFNGVNNVKDTVRTGLDKGVSLFTGQRTATLPDLKAQYNGFKTGSKDALLDFVRDVDTRNADKFELNNNVRWNKNGNIFEKAMHQLNRTEKLFLTDRPFEGASYAKEMARLKKVADLNGVKFNEADAIEKAKQVGLYETFNDDSYMSTVATNLKRTLNSGKEWGAGDVLMKFAKTPANIAQRAVDYSVGGLFKSIKAAVNKNGFDQETFTNELAKSATGAGIVGLGYELSKLGVINTDSEKNKNARALNQSSGLGDFRINLSGLNRALKGGDGKLDKGDLHINYDWMQPISVLMALGVELSSRDKEVSNKAVALAEGLFSGFNGLIDQPMTQGLQNLFGTGDFAESAKKFMASIPQTFVPSVVNNLKQMINNESKETYDPNVFKQGLNQAKNRIPMLSNTLPTRKDVFGNEREVYQNKTNNPINIMLNPAITTRYLPTSYGENAKNLYNETGDTSVLPKVAPKKINIDGKQYKLSQEEMLKWQETIGKESKNIYNTQRTDTKSVVKELNKATEKAKEDFLKGRKLPMPFKGR